MVRRSFNAVGVLRLPVSRHIHADSIG
eukprot:COSAG06_NODE_64156_length_260_cov_0.645963_1_plen_26_part_10